MDEDDVTRMRMPIISSFSDALNQINTCVCPMCLYRTSEQAPETYDERRNQCEWCYHEGTVPADFYAHMREIMRDYRTAERAADYSHSDIALAPTIANAHALDANAPHFPLGDILSDHQVAVTDHPSAWRFAVWPDMPTQLRDGRTVPGYKVVTYTKAFHRLPWAFPLRIRIGVAIDEILGYLITQTNAFKDIVRLDQAPIWSAVAKEAIPQ